MSKDYLSLLIDKIFNIKKQTWILFSIFLVGLVLRIVAAINISVSADDMHFVTHAINFYKSDRLVTYDQSSGLWFAITSIFYNLFGTTQLVSRLAALIFGSLTIFVIYFLAKEFFDEKIALISAFLLAIAPFHIKYTVAEMDVMAMFFVSFSMLFFIKALKSPRISLFIVGGTLLGLAVYTKVYPLLFIPSLLIFFVYVQKKENKKAFSKQNIKYILAFLFAVFIFAIPALTHNYLLYKDKGFLDLQFTRTLGLGKENSAQYYSWDVQFERKNSWKGLIFGDLDYGGGGKPLLWAAIDFIRLGDPTSFYLGILGLLIIFKYRKEYKKYSILFITSIAFALPFLASIILLPKHFIFLDILLMPIVALSVNEIITKANSISKKNFTIPVLLVILMVSLIVLGLPRTATEKHFYGKSHVAQAIEFKEESIPPGSLMVIDSRFYRGRANWMSYGRPYMEGSDFLNVLNSQGQLQGEEIPVQVFFLECVPDDCGWGTIQDQPEFNQTMEAMVQVFEQQGNLVKSIQEPDRSQSYYPLSNSKINTMNIYSMTISLKSEILNYASQPKNWFLYTIGYQPKEAQFDYYKANGAFNIFLDSLAHWIVSLSIFFAFLSILYILYLAIKI